MIPEVDGHDGSFVVLVNNQRKPVCQDISFVGDGDIHILERFRCPGGLQQDRRKEQPENGISSFRSQHKILPRTDGHQTSLASYVTFEFLPEHSSLSPGVQLALVWSS